MARLSLAEKAILDNRRCETCDGRLVRTYGETNARWIARRFCSLKCASAKRRVPLEDRFFDKVDATPGYGPNGDCHVWTGAKSSQGYGAIQVARSALPAHRVAWELANGRKIPDGMFIMHSCDNPPCVNPGHLSPGTPLENMLDKAKKGRGNAPAGEKSGAAKITARDATAIYADPRPPALIAEDYPITEALIRRIKAGKAWRAVTGAP